MAKISKTDHKRHPRQYQRQKSESVQLVEDELVVSDGSQLEFELSIDNDKSISRSKSPVSRRGSVSTAIATSSAAESTSDGRRNRVIERKNVSRRYRKRSSSSSSSCSSTSSSSSSSSSESDDENKPYFVDKKREIERLQRKQLKQNRKSHSDRVERTAKNQLSERQIKRKERFAKYRLEKKIQRQLVSGNQQQQQRQQQQQQQQPPSQVQQQQCNVQQHNNNASNIGIPQQQQPTEWNDQPRVVFVQVPPMAYPHMDYGMAPMHNMHYLPHPPPPPNGFCHPIPPHPAHYRRQRPMFNGFYRPPMMPMQRCPPFRSFHRYPPANFHPKPFRKFPNPNGI